MGGTLPKSFHPSGDSDGAVVGDDDEVLSQCSAEEGEEDVLTGDDSLGRRENNDLKHKKNPIVILILEDEINTEQINEQN